MAELIKPKSIFKSKTAMAQALVMLAGAVGTMWPEASQFISTHANTILLVSGAVGFGLRLITKGRVVLFPESD